MISLHILRVLVLLSVLSCGRADARGKYPIHEDFRGISHFSAPMGRAFFAAGNAFLSVAPKGIGKKDGVSVRKEQMEDGVKGWMISPLEGRDSSRCILLIHGGGFVYKASSYQFAHAAQYALESGCDVFFIDYPMAYNRDYGIPLGQCETALRVLQCWYSAVSVMGDSAGGFLAIKTALGAEVKPDRLCLIYPVVDCSMRTESMARFSDTPVFNGRAAVRMWEFYLQGNAEQSLLDADLSGLPPTYVETAEFDCLHDEGLLFAEKLRAFGIPVTVNETKGTPHGYDLVRKSHITRESLIARCEFLSTVKWK